MANVHTRKPTLQVMVNGTSVAGVLSAEVTADSFYTAARYRVRLASTAIDLDWFNAQQALEIEILAGLGDGWNSLVVGFADSLRWDPIAGVLDLEGRDLAASLIAARSQESFPNRTASEIAAELAGRHGLSPVVVATKALVGRVDQSGWSRLTLDRHARATTEWDLLVALAQHEACDLYVSGRSLVFGASSEQPPAPVEISPSDCISLDFDRMLGLEQQVEVVVKSWNVAERRALKQSVQSGNSGAVRQSVFVRPNLNDAQAGQLAQSALAELMSHSQVMSASIPGEFSLSPRALVQMSGVGGGFDGTYRLTMVERMIDMKRGFVQHIRGSAV